MLSPPVAVRQTVAPPPLPQLWACANGAAQSAMKKKTLVNRNFMVTPPVGCVTLAQQNGASDFPLWKRGYWEDLPCTAVNSQTEQIPLGPCSKVGKQSHHIHCACPW